MPPKAWEKTVQKDIAKVNYEPFCESVSDITIFGWQTTVAVEQDNT